MLAESTCVCEPVSAPNECLMHRLDKQEAENRSHMNALADAKYKLEIELEGAIAEVVRLAADGQALRDHNKLAASRLGL